MQDLRDSASIIFTTEDSNSSMLDDKSCSASMFDPSAQDPNNFTEAMTADDSVEIMTNITADEGNFSASGTDVCLRKTNDHYSEEELLDMQRCRAELRERFLWAMTGLTGHYVEVSMLEQLNVAGTLRGIDKDGLVVHVEKLTTPLVVLPWASLRLPDCLSLKFKLKGGVN